MISLHKLHSHIFQEEFKNFSKIEHQISNHDSVSDVQKLLENMVQDLRE